MPSLVDSGAMVAAIDESTRHFRRFRQLIDAEPRPLITSEACVAEAMYLLGREAGWPGQRALLALLGTWPLDVRPAAQRYPQLSDLMSRYSDLPMDYADATLVDIALQTGINRIMTVDFRDFGVYRLGRRSFEILGPL